MMKYRSIFPRQSIISNYNTCFTTKQLKKLKNFKKKMCVEINNVIRCKKKNIDIGIQLSFTRDNKEDGRLL